MTPDQTLIPATFLINVEMWRKWVILRSNTSFGMSS